MTEPLFFDCLTDMQIWSLFDAGVLHDYRLPVEVYERLAHIAPEHGCYLFTGPRGVDLPALQDLVPGMVVSEGELPGPIHSHGLESTTTTERLRAGIEAFCARVHTDRVPAGGRIYLMRTIPRPSLRPGPYLEPRVRDLNAMSLPELEAYLNDVLRVDEASTRC
jgi:hypothetical protein